MTPRQVRQRLARGRCQYCSAVLADWNSSGFCDDECDKADRQCW